MLRDPDSLVSVCNTRIKDNLFLQFLQKVQLFFDFSSMWEKPGESPGTLTAALDAKLASAVYLRGLRDRRR